MIYEYNYRIMVWLSFYYMEPQEAENNKVIEKQEQQQATRKGFLRHHHPFGHVG